VFPVASDTNRMLGGIGYQLVNTDDNVCPLAGVADDLTLVRSAVIAGELLKRDTRPNQAGDRTR
jgi:hypothetical protein